MDIGKAVDALKAGKSVSRAGWNGKGMFVYLVPPASYPAQTGAAIEHFGKGSTVPYNAYLALKGTDGRVSTWVPSINDTLAVDWEIFTGLAAEALEPLKPVITDPFFERDETAERLDKLDSFILSGGFAALDQDNRILLQRQALQMRGYVDTLDARIKLIDGKSAAAQFGKPENFEDPDNGIIETRTTGGGSVETPVPFNG